MQRLALIASVLLLAAATAHAVSSGYEDRLRAAQSEATAQRKKLGLDDRAQRPALYAKYPTPEVTFEGEAPKLGCGASAPVQLKGSWPKGTLFVVDNDGAALSEIKDDGHTFRALLKTAAVAIGSVQLTAISPVSGADRSTRAADIRARYELELKFEDGWTAHFTPSEADPSSGQLQGQLQWKKGDKTRESAAQADPDTNQLKLKIAPGPETQAVMADFSAKVDEDPGDNGTAAAQAAYGQCMKKPSATQVACVEKSSEPMAKFAEKTRKRMEKLHSDYEKSLPKDAWGCDTVELTVKGSSISGLANCAAETKQKVTGTIACTGPIAAE